MSTRSGVGLAVVAVIVAIGICVVVTPSLGHSAGSLVPAALGEPLVLALLAAMIGRRAYRHECLNRELRKRARAATVGGIEVWQLTGIDGAFVAGLRRPRIFCAQHLGLDLAPEEMKAVLLHERYHQLDRAPAKLVVLEAIAPLVAALRLGRGWLASQIAALEIAADRHAIAHGASRAALASALLKVKPIGPGGVGIGFATAAEMRLEALLDLTREGPTVLSVWFVVPLAIAAVCVMFIGLT